MQSLCNRFAIALQFLRNRFTIALQSLCNSFAIASQSLRSRLTIASQSLQNRFAIPLQLLRKPLASPSQSCAILRKRWAFALNAPRNRCESYCKSCACDMKSTRSRCEIDAHSEFNRIAIAAIALQSLRNHIAKAARFALPQLRNRREIAS